MSFVPSLYDRRYSKKNSAAHEAQPFCECWNDNAPTPWSQMNACSCGEGNYAANEWCWESPETENATKAVVSNDLKQVTFHPFFSSGTAAVRGNMPFHHDRHYYFEIKMLTETYGTDIMVGLCSSKMDTLDSQFKFISLLGLDEDSYGLSYKGYLRHNSMVMGHSAGFCRGSIIGVKVDMWHGTLEFYLNRQPTGVIFDQLRRHKYLYPIICSTAAQSSMRLIYASSFRASLLVDAARTLAASVLMSHRRLRVPPGLWTQIRSEFWMVLPTEGCINEDNDDESMDIEQINLSTSVLCELMPSRYMNGFYIDSVDRDYRLVLWQ